MKLIQTTVRRRLIHLDALFSLESAVALQKRKKKEKKKSIILSWRR